MEIIYRLLEVIEDMGLQEINTGVAAGRTKDWVSENRNPRLGIGFDIDHQEFKDGETFRQFYSRVCNCMGKICSEENKNIIIVTHGGTLGYIIAWWMNFGSQMLAKAYFSASPGSISLLQENNFQQHNLKMLNDKSHLSELR